MNTSLPSSSFRRFVCLALTGVFFFAFSSGLLAQDGGNLLINGSFESPAVAVTNGNNIMGVGVTWSGWSCTNGGLNILRVQGSGYGSGANNAASGSQYVDVANSDGYIYQSFTLPNVSPVYFSGSFSNRESGWADYVNWTARIDILDSTGTVIATSSTRDFITTDNNETWYTLTGATSNLPGGTYTYRAYAGNSGHFDDAFVNALADMVLPVKLERFTAALKGGEVVTDWTVSEEENVKGYELQSSIDGIHFKGVNFLPANHSSHYSTIDQNPAEGLSYYRLKMYDLDGKSSYSAICQIEFKAGDTFSVYPNPATGFFHLAVNDDMMRKNGSLMILTSAGRVVQQQNFTAMNRTEIIDIAQLSPGTYFVRLTSGKKVMSKMLRVMAR